jgi:hypothetical protein
MKFKVPVVWMMEATVEVEADTLEEAVQRVKDDDNLPPGQYIQQTFEVVDGLLEDINQ